MAFLAISLVCAALMGFAVQRGGTCMVAALDQLLATGRGARAIALLEAALWVGGGVALLRLAGVRFASPPEYGSPAAALVGGALLGIGAWVNRGCALGTVARLGSGEWSYAAMPLGFFAGSHLAWAWLGPRPTMAAPLGGPWLAVLLASVLAVLLPWRTAGCVQAARQRQFLAHIWAPHRATIVIALAFLALMLAAGHWTYTQWLVDLARGQSAMSEPRLLLFVALFGGAIAGGITARADPVRPTVAAAARSLAGGLTMGIGGQLVPGGNDGLILVGLPLLQYPAILALLAMAATIAAAIALGRGFSGKGSKPRSA